MIHYVYIKSIKVDLLGREQEAETETDADTHTQKDTKETNVNAEEQK